MNNLGETEKSDSPVSREQEGEEEGPPLKQLRLGRGPGRPKKLPELNGMRGRKRERGSCKSGQSSSSTLQARPRKSKHHKHRLTHTSYQNGETGHPPPPPHSGTPSPVFINLCSPSPTSTNTSTLEHRMPSASTSELGTCNTIDPGAGTQSTYVGSHVSVNQPPTSVLPSRSASKDMATLSGATSTLPTDSSLQVDTSALSRRHQSGTTSTNSNSSASMAWGATTETPSINSTHPHSYFFRLRPRRSRPTSSNQNQTVEAQSYSSSSHIPAQQNAPSTSISNHFTTEPQNIISSHPSNVTAHPSIHVHANTVSISTGLPPVMSGSTSHSATPLETPTGSQRSQSSVDTVMDSYWSNVRSQLDRSTAFIASQSNRRTGNGSPAPSHLRRMPRSQPSDSTESNSQGTSSVLNTSRSSREASRNGSSRPFRPTSHWYHSCPFRPSNSSEPNSQGPSFDVSESSNPGPWQVPYPLQDSSSSLMHDFDTMYSSDDDLEVHVLQPRYQSSPTRRSQWRMNYVGSGRVAGASQTVPSTSGNSQSSEVEVIVVDSEDDEEDDVIIGAVEEGNGDSRQRQIANDEVFARELQEQFDQEASVTQIPPSPHIWSARGPSGAVPVVSFSVSPSPTSLPPQQEEGDDEEGTRLVHDNFDALASRVRSWTTADAARFLRVATHRGRRRPRNQQDFMNAVIDLSPTLLYHAILGSSVRGPTNTYEDLLEIADRLGPARSQGLSRQDINSLPVREFSAAKDSQGSSSGTTQCVVCMCDFEDAEKVVTLPCIHDFHQRCITQWLKDHRTCPICRVAVGV